MPAIASEEVAYNGANLAANTYTATKRITLAPNPTSGDKTQQVWAFISWDGLSAGDLRVRVRNKPMVTVPASASREGIVVADSGLQTSSPGSGSVLTFIEVAGPDLEIETVVNGAGTPNVTVYIQSTAEITLS
jgi:hypothetical protein